MKKSVFLILFLSLPIFAQDKSNYDLEFINLKPNGYFLEPSLNHPYSPNLSYMFGLPDSSNVVANIQSENGDENILSFNRIMAPGIYIIRWNGKLIDNNDVLPGNYILKIKVEYNSLRNLKCYFEASTKIIITK